MTRGLNASMLTDIALASAEEIQFIELQFSAATTRLCTGFVDISWNGFTWQAVGGRLEMEGFTESPEFSQNGMRLTMGGVDTAIIAQILGSNFVGRPAKIWHGHLSPTTGAVIGGATGPALMFDGRMNDSWEINETHGDFGGGEVLVSSRIESRISEIDKMRGIRTNIISHQSSGISGADDDTYFKNVGGLVNTKVYWGRNAPSSGVPGSGPRGRERDPSQGQPRANPWGGGGGHPPPPTNPHGGDNPDRPHTHG